MNNTILSTKIKQVRKAREMKPLNQKVLEDPVGYFGKKSLATRMILDALIAYSNGSTKVFPSQTTLANMAGVLRQTVNEIVSRLHDDGIILSQYRHMHTNTYTLSPFFNNPAIRQKLSGLFPSLKAISLTMLTFFYPVMSVMCNRIELENKNKKTLQNQYIYRFSYATPTQRNKCKYIRALRWAQYTARSGQPRVGTELVPPPGMAFTEIPLSLRPTATALKETAADRYAGQFYYELSRETSLLPKDFAQLVAFMEFERLHNRQRAISSTESDNSNGRFRQYRRARQNSIIEQIFKSRSVPSVEEHSPCESSMSNTEHVPSVMEVISPVPSVLDELSSSLKLTQWGKLKLSAFPDAALCYGADKLKYSKNIRDKFAFIVKLCTDYCRDNNVKPDWLRVDKLKRELNMPEDAKMTDAYIIERAAPATAGSMVNDHAKVQREYEEKQKRLADREEQQRLKKQALEDRRERDILANPIATITEWFLFEEKRNNGIKTFSRGLMALPKVVDELRAAENPYVNKAQEYCIQLGLNFNELAPLTYQELTDLLQGII